MKKGYYKIALDNLSFLERNLNSNKYNDLAIVAEQISEKMLKSILELEDPNARQLLNSCNLRNIFIRLQDCGISLNLDKRDLADLKDVYFDARYPGENYIDVHREDCENYIQTMYNVITEVNLYRKNRGLFVREVIVRKLGESVALDIQDTFNCYRNKFNITDDKVWFMEIYRLSTICGSSDLNDIANFILKQFL